MTNCQLLRGPPHAHTPPLFVYVSSGSLLLPSRLSMDVTASATPAVDDSSALADAFISALIITAQHGFVADVDPFVGLCPETWGEEQLFDALKDLPHGLSRRTRLMHAAFAGNVSRLRWLLRRGAKLELEDAQQCTALGWACRSGRIDVVAELVRVGASVRGGARGGALTDAVSGGHAPCALLLLERGATLTRSSLLALMARCAIAPDLLAGLCARAQVSLTSRDILEPYIKKGFPLEHWDTSRHVGPSMPTTWCLPLETLQSLVTMNSALAGNHVVIDVACFFCSETAAIGILTSAAQCGALDADFPLTNYFGSRFAKISPLSKAVSSGRADTVAALIRAGATATDAVVRGVGTAAILEALLLTATPAVNITRSSVTRVPKLTRASLETQLLAAAAVGSLKVLAMLLGEEEEDDASEEPLAVADEATARRCRELLSCAADGNGFSPLLLAISSGHTRAASYLLKAGAPHVSRGGGISALALAAGADDHVMVQTLLTRGAADGPEGMDDARDATMHAAAAGFSRVLTQILCFRGAPAFMELKNARDPKFHGRTPLHWAASGGHDEAVRVLLELSADATTVAHGSPGKTPASLAFDAGHHELAKMIREAGGNSKGPCRVPVAR